MPDDKAAAQALDEAWSRLTLEQAGGPMTLTVKGHPVHVPKAALGAARFSFHDLCEQPLGAADYLRIAREFHTIVLDHVPVMRYETRNEAKRFIALIDTLYDNSVKLIASAAASRRTCTRPRKASRRPNSAHRLAADRDGIAKLSVAAAWSALGRGHAARKTSSTPDRHRCAPPPGLRILQCTVSLSAAHDNPIGKAENGGIMYYWRQEDLLQRASCRHPPDGLTTARP